MALTSTCQVADAASPRKSCSACPRLPIPTWMFLFGTAPGTGVQSIPGKFRPLIWTITNLIVVDRSGRLPDAFERWSGDRVDRAGGGGVAAGAVATRSLEDWTRLASP